MQTRRFPARRCFAAAAALLWRAACALAWGASLVACVQTPTPPPPPVPLAVASSTAAMPLVSLLADRFQARHASVIISIELRDSAQVAAQVSQAEVDLGVISAVPPPELWAAPIALDGIAIVVHPQNALADLTRAQLHDVFDGHTWQWSELGVSIPGDEAIVVSREAGSGTRVAFETGAMAGGRDLPAECQQVGMAQPDAGTRNDVPDPGSRCAVDPVTSMAVIMPDSASVVEFVATHPGAIGYVAHSYLALTPEARSRVKVLRIEGALPGPQDVAAGTYALSHPFFLVASQEPAGTARLFLDFCLGSEGQSIIAETLVPVRP